MKRVAYLAALGFAWAVATAAADTFTWDGGSIVTDNWSDAANWVGNLVPPTAGIDSADVVFAGGIALSPVLNQNYAIHSLAFDATAGAFNLLSSGGSILTIGDGGIQNNSSLTQQILARLTVPRNQTWSATGGDLSIGGTVTGSADLTLSGDGHIITLDGSMTNWNGDLSITAGATAEFGAADRLDSGSSVTVAKDAILDLQGFSQTIGGLSGAGNVVIGTALLQVDTQGQSTLFSGAIQGNGSSALWKLGAGTLTLTGNTTLLAETVVGGGVLQIGDGGTTGSVAGNLTATGADVWFNRSDDVAFAGLIEGIAGDIVQVGVGTLTLTADNTFNGNVRVENGTLAVDRVADGGQASPLGAQGAGSPIVLGAAGQTGTLQFTGGNDSTNRNWRFATGGTGRIDIVQAGTTLTLSGGLIGDGDFIKSGPGTLELTGNAAIHTGNVSIDAGTVRLAGGDAIGDASTVTIANGAALDAGAGESIGGLAGAGAVVYTVGPLAIGANGETTEYSGNIAGLGLLRKIGLGTLTITSDHTLVGGVTVIGGTLQIGNGGATGDILPITGVGTVTVNSALVINRSGTVGFPMPIGGGVGGSVTLKGGGFWTPSPVNTFTGALRVADGVLTASVIADGGQPSSLGGAPATVGVFLGDSGTTGTIRYTGPTAHSDRSYVLFTQTGSGVLNVTDPAATLSLSGELSGLGSFRKVGPGTLALSGSNTFTGTVEIAEGVLSVNAVANGGLPSSLGAADASATIHVGGPTNSAGFRFTGGTDSTNRRWELDAGGGLFDVVDPAADLSLIGLVSGAGGLTKSGGGTLVLLGNNTFPGPVRVAEGTISVTRFADGGLPSSLGAGPSDVPIELGAPGQTGGLRFQIVSGDSSDRELHLADGGVGRLEIPFGTPAVTLSGRIGGGGSLVLDGGDGTFYLSGLNDFTGALAVESGTLMAGTIVGGGLPSSLGSSPAVTPVSLGAANGKGTIRYTGGSTSSDRAWQLAAGTLGGEFDIVESGTVLTLTGAIGGPGPLSKTGPGTLEITAATSHQGNTSVEQGTLKLTAADALASSPQVRVEAGAMLDSVGRNQTFQQLTGAGQVLLGGAELSVREGLFTGSLDYGLLRVGVAFPDIFTFGGNPLPAAPIEIAADAQFTLTAPHVLDAATGINMGTDSSMILNAGDQAAANIQGGRLNLGVNSLTLNQDAVDGQIQSLSGSGSLVKNGPRTFTINGANVGYTGTTLVNAGEIRLVHASGLFNSAVVLNSGATLNLNGLNARMGSLAGGGDVAMGSNSFMIVGDNNFSTTYSGTITGTGTLNKSGAGVMTLAGAQVLAGGGSITAGTLALDDAARIGGFVILFDGARLQGTGRVAALSLRGIAAPGNSLGALILENNVGMTATGRLEIELGGVTAASEHDVLQVGASATLNGTLDVSLVGGFVPAAGDRFTVMTYGSRGGSFATMNGLTPAPGIALNPIFGATNLTLFATATGEKTWGVDASGNASLATNWIGGVAPGGVGDVAAFTTIISANRQVAIDAPTTLGTLRFDDDNSYSLVGPQAITLHAAGDDPAVVRVDNAHGDGAHAINAPLVLASDLDFVHHSAAVFTLSGPLDNSAGLAITKSGPGTAVVSGPQSHGPGAGLNVTEGALRLASNTGVPAASAATANLSIHVEAGGTLEIQADQDLGPFVVAEASARAVIDYVTDSEHKVRIYDGGTATGSTIFQSAIDDLWLDITTGYNGGTWDGTGIGTTAITESNVNGLGLVLETDANGAQYVGIREMILGDVNGDDFVDAGDASVLFGGIGADGTWLAGDLNYDQFIDAGDAGVLFAALGQSFDPGFGPLAVPEPTTLGLLVIGALLAAPRLLRSRSSRA